MVKRDLKVKKLRVIFSSLILFTASCENYKTVPDSYASSDNVNQIPEDIERDCNRCKGTGIIACGMCGGNGVNDMGMECGCLRYNNVMRQMGKETDPNQGPYRNCDNCKGTGKVLIRTKPITHESLSATQQPSSVDYYSGGDGVDDLEDGPEESYDPTINPSIGDAFINSGYVIGQKMQGGIIFMLDESRKKGLVVSKFSSSGTWVDLKIFFEQKEIMDGYTDWRLPTQKEMQILNTISKDSIPYK